MGETSVWFVQLFGSARLALLARLARLAFIYI
jgi:hypothetical protein